MKQFTFYILMLLSIQGISQTDDTAPWCPPGANWVYSVFSPSDNRNLQLSYIKDTVMFGKTVKQMKTQEIRFIDINLTVRIVTDLGFEYYYNSNDSVYFLDNGVFKFIYDFTPQIGDKWITGSSKITCPTPGFPSSDTITVDSVKKITLGNKNYEFIFNNSFSRNYLLGSVIKNVGSQNGPYPYVNRNKCPSSSGFFQGLICYSDDIRGVVPMPNSSLSWCHSVITSLPDIQLSSQTNLIKVFPNPTRDILRISGLRGGKITFQLFDVLGHNISSGNIVNNEINVSKFTSGLYLILIETSDKKIVAKFIKQ